MPPLEQISVDAVSPSGAGRFIHPIESVVISLANVCCEILSSTRGTEACVMVGAEDNLLDRVGVRRVGVLDGEAMSDFVVAAAARFIAAANRLGDAAGEDFDDVEEEKDVRAEVRGDILGDLTDIGTVTAPVVGLAEGGVRLEIGETPAKRRLDFRWLETGEGASPPPLTRSSSILNLPAF